MTRLWRYRVRKLVALRRREVLDLLYAQWRLISAQAMVWVRPAGSLLSPSSTQTPPSPPSHSTAQALRYARALGRAANHGIFRPTCLVRAIALQRMLEGAGLVGSRVCVGVRKGDDRFAAHAWVEYGTLILADRRENVESYVHLPGVHVQFRS
jgi:hypothetical protein